MPLLVELMSETGLNMESALSLKRDCFNEAHPLTGLPFLEYEKPRSGGEKELHVALYDDESANSPWASSNASHESSAIQSTPSSN